MERRFTPQKIHPRVKNAMAMSQQVIPVHSDRDIEALESIDVDDNVKYELIRFPDPPIALSAHCNGDRAIVWWNYENRGKDPVLSWELRRYKLDKDGSWSVKGVKQFKDVATRKYTVPGLEIDNFYRFTVSAISRHGKGAESRMSNSVYADLPLPNGWFKSTAADGSMFYFNLNTGATSATRPDRDPYFISDEAVLQLLKPHEVKHLREIFDEEILHFEKVTRERLSAILLELGERMIARQIGTIFREYSTSPEAVRDYQTFMEIMYQLKIQAKNNKNVTAQLSQVTSSLFSCCSRNDDIHGAGPTSLLERVGNWEIRKANQIDRIYYCEKGSPRRNWTAPLEVRLYLPPDGLLQEVTERHFDPIEVDLLKNAYFHMDVKSNGRVNAVEFFRFIYIMSHANRDPPGSDLPPNTFMLRNEIFTVVCTTCKYALCYQDHLLFFIALKTNRTEDMQKYRTAMPALNGLVITRKVLSQTIETYLISRKEGKFEKEPVTNVIQLPLADMKVGVNGGCKVTVANCANQASDDDDYVRSFDDEQIARTGEGSSWFGGKLKRYSVGANGEMIEHDMCCMCGCREQLYS